MADSSSYREYVLADALCDIAIGGFDQNEGLIERASEWVATHVAELETRVVELEAASGLPAMHAKLDELLARGTPQKMAPETTEREQPVIGARLSPNGMTPQEWHDLHVAIEKAKQDAPTHAPEHVSAGRLPVNGETVCARPHWRDGARVADCARQMWHDGPHMDVVAVNHAGKAGEVWA